VFVPFGAASEIDTVVSAREGVFYRSKDHQVNRADPRIRLVEAVAEQQHLYAGRQGE